MWVQRSETGKTSDSTMGERLQHQRIAGRPQVDVAAVFQGDTVEQTKAEILGKEIGLNAPFRSWPMTPKRPDIGIRRIVPPPVTQPPIGNIENGIGGKTGKHHHQTIDDTGGPVNSLNFGPQKCRLRVTTGSQ